VVRCKGCKRCVPISVDGPDGRRDSPLPNLHGAALLYCLHRSAPRVAILGSDALLAGETLMAGLDIGGYEQRPDWPKMGPPLLIAACLVLAIRTAKWPPRSSGGTISDRELEVEVENAVHLAGRVLSSLVSRHGAMFPSKKEPWFVPNGEDTPK
jgi:hypothetical protein